MGWTTLHREKGLSNAKFFEREWGSIEVLDSATVDGVFYAAGRKLQKTDPEFGEPDEVFGLVCLVSWAPNSRHNFGYKDMDETCGPHETKCPDRILDLLTETDSEYANEWRQKCRAYNAAQAAKPKVKKGDVVKFAHALTFSNGDKLDTFTFEGRNTFRANGRRYNLGNWRRKYGYALA